MHVCINQYIQEDISLLDMQYFIWGSSSNSTKIQLNKKSEEFVFLQCLKITVSLWLWFEEGRDEFYLLSTQMSQMNLFSMLRISNIILCGKFLITVIPIYTWSLNDTYIYKFYQTCMKNMVNSHFLEDT